MNSLEVKLTELLEDTHDMQDSEDEELREAIMTKDDQIRRMNEEFSREIKKYNTVFEHMKQELSELRSYESIDLTLKIDSLENQILKLREEKERDAMIIKRLSSQVEY